MYALIPGILYQGDVVDGTDPTRWEANGIRAILNVAMEVQPPANRPVDYFWLQLADGVATYPSIIDYALLFINNKVRENKPVLVHCGAGISRSSLMTLSYLLQFFPTMNDALTFLRARHPTANPNPAFLPELQERARVRETQVNAIRGLQQ
jgi:protein-tyrosine phosphatase